MKHDKKKEKYVAYLMMCPLMIVFLTGVALIFRSIYISAGATPFLITAFLMGISALFAEGLIRLFNE